MGREGIGAAANAAVGHRADTVVGVSARFDRDTAVTAAPDGHLEATMSPGWWIERGPNGGYVAAVILRALSTAVEDPTRTPRSFTVHYLAPPAEGPVRIEVQTERTGRMLTFVSGRVEQDGRLIATAQAAFAPPLPGVEFCDLQPPDGLPPDAIEPMVMPPGAPVIPLRERYEMRWAVGSLPFSGAPQAVAGGWIRLRPEEGTRPADHILIAALTDAWMPPVFTRVDTPMAVPTIDLTIHFRSPIPPDVGAWYLVVFRSQMATDGFVEEDGEVWSADGRLLAHSRQLAVLLPRPG
jgi:acyl-CoA thioesterase